MNIAYQYQNRNRVKVYTDLGVNYEDAVHNIANILKIENMLELIDNCREMDSKRICQIRLKLLRHLALELDRGQNIMVPANHTGQMISLPHYIFQDDKIGVVQEENLKHKKLV